MNPIFAPTVLFLLAACATAPQAEIETERAVPQPDPLASTAAADTAQRIAQVAGFSGPEAVRYDAEQDVYFVANFNGGGNERDNNGFISRLRPDGEIERLRFVAGGENGVTLHAPRGMFIVGDTLWAADVDAVRGFDRRSGAPVANVDFSGMDVGFLNDIAAGPDGVLYVTDTGRNRIYGIRGRTISVVLADSVLGSPNGITWDGANQRFVVVPFGGNNAIFAWHPDRTGLEVIGTSPGGRFDGVEVLGDGRILVASQADTSLHAFRGGTGRPLARTAGRPADIGVDTRRGRVAVPFIALNMVEIWRLPSN